MWARQRTIKMILRVCLMNYEIDNNTQNPETAQHRCNDRKRKPIHSTQAPGIQELANRVNGNDIGKSLGKISKVLEKLTTQQANIPNVATRNGLKVGEANLRCRKIATRVPTERSHRVSGITRGA